MEFIGQPNLYVKISSKIVQRITGVKGIAFDASGHCSTNNETLIKILLQHFEPVKTENNTVTVQEPDSENKETKIYKCKQCSFENDNMGKLLAHIRKEHKKEG